MPTTIDLTPFCAERHHSAYQITEPFVISGKRYATNGYVLIEVPADGEPDTAERKLPRNVLELLADYNASLPWQAFGDVAYVQEMRRCPDCDGSGYARHRKCDQCSGDGEIACGECGHLQICKRCNGRAIVGCGKCDSCGGVKERMQPAHAFIDGLKMAYRVVENLRALPGVQYAAAGKKLLVRFDCGGRGIAMPLVR